MDCAFYVLDAVGAKFCYTVADASYAPAFRKHTRWWKTHASSAEYRAKVDPMRWPVFPLKTIIEPIARA